MAAKTGWNSTWIHGIIEPAVVKNGTIHVHTLYPDNESPIEG